MEISNLRRSDSGPSHDVKHRVERAKAGPLRVLMNVDIRSLYRVSLAMLSSLV